MKEDNRKCDNCAGRKGYHYNWYFMSDNKVICWWCYWSAQKITDIRGQNY